jgi:hypothetical protein
VVKVTKSDGQTAEYDEGRDVSASTSGNLTVLGPSGVTVAIYAPGSWVSVDVVRAK